MDKIIIFIIFCLFTLPPKFLLAGPENELPSLQVVTHLENCPSDPCAQTALITIFNVRGFEEAKQETKKILKDVDDDNIILVNINENRRTEYEDRASSLVSDRQLSEIKKITFPVESLEEKPFYQKHEGTFIISKAIYAGTVYGLIAYFQTLSPSLGFASGILTGFFFRTLQKNSDPIVTWISKHGFKPNITSSPNAPIIERFGKQFLYSFTFLYFLQQLSFAMPLQDSLKYENVELLGSTILKNQFYTLGLSEYFFLLRFNSLSPLTPEQESRLNIVTYSIGLVSITATALSLFNIQLGEFILYTYLAAGTPLYLWKSGKLNFLKQYFSEFVKIIWDPCKKLNLHLLWHQ